MCCVGPCRQLCVVSGEKAKVEKYSSVGLDGAMVIWDFKVHVSNFFSTNVKLCLTGSIITQLHMNVIILKGQFTSKTRILIFL